jgi:hypothetical protein
VIIAWIYSLLDMAAPSHIFFGAAAPDAAGAKRTKMESSSGSSSSDDERLALTEESRSALQRQNELVTDMKLQMRFRTIAAPTLDNDVRMKLRCFPPPPSLPQNSVPPTP